VYNFQVLFITPLPFTEPLAVPFDLGKIITKIYGCKKFNLLSEPNIE
jgi:hypothetical protein